jgi:hypothetical protein
MKPELTEAEIRSWPTPQLAAALSAVVFVLGFDLDAARVVKVAAERLRSLPEGDSHRE